MLSITANKIIDVISDFQLAQCIKKPLLKKEGLIGNTDCANCSSHLVQLPTNFNKKSISFSFEEVELIHNSN